MGMHEREVMLLAQLVGEVAHVGVHRLHPANERAGILGELGLAHAVHEHAMTLLLQRQPAAAAREDVDLRARRHEVLGELSHVSCEPAFDESGGYSQEISRTRMPRSGTLSVAAKRERQVAGVAAALDTGAKFGSRRSTKLATPSAKSGG